MARDHLLLIDADPDNASVMQLALRQSGYSVAKAHTLEGAKEVLEESDPSLVVIDYESCQEKAPEILEQFLGEEAKWSHLPCIYLCEASEQAQILEQLKASSHCLTKPIYLREVTSRVHLLLEKKRRDQWAGRDGARSRFSGELSDLGVIDLIQTIDLCKKSGVVNIESVGRQGQIWFKNGALIDANFGKLQAEAAIYRMIRLETGSFGVQFKKVRRAKAMSASTQRMLLEGLSQLDKWHRLCEQLPSLDQPLQADPEQLKSESGSSGASATGVSGILHRFKSGKTIRRILHETERNDLELLEVLSEVYFSGALLPADEDAEVSQSCLEQSAVLEPANPSHRLPKDRPISFTEPIVEDEPGFVARPKAMTQPMIRTGPTAIPMQSPSVKTHAAAHASAIQAPPPAGTSRRGRAASAKVRTLMIPFNSQEDEPTEVQASTAKQTRPKSSTLVYLQDENRPPVPPFRSSTPTAARPGKNEGPASNQAPLTTAPPLAQKPAAAPAPAKSQEPSKVSGKPSASRSMTRATMWLDLEDEHPPRPWISAAIAVGCAITVGLVITQGKRIQPPPAPSPAQELRLSAQGAQEEMQDPETLADPGQDDELASDDLDWIGADSLHGDDKDEQDLADADPSELSSDAPNESRGLDSPISHPEYPPVPEDKAPAQNPTPEPAKDDSKGEAENEAQPEAQTEAENKAEEPHEQAPKASNTETKDAAKSPKQDKEADHGR